MEEKEKIRPVINKLSESLVLLALLEMKLPTNKELSKHIGFSPQQTSTYLKKLKEYEYIQVIKNSNSINKFDQREVRIKLTKLGAAQAWLARASVNIMPGRDDVAISIIKGIKKVLKK